MVRVSSGPSLLQMEAMTCSVFMPFSSAIRSSAFLNSAYPILVWPCSHEHMKWVQEPCKPKLFASRLLWTACACS